MVTTFYIFKIFKKYIFALENLSMKALSKNIVTTFFSLLEKKKSKVEVNNL